MSGIQVVQELDISELDQASLCILGTVVADLAWANKSMATDFRGIRNRSGSKPSEEIGSGFELKQKKLDSSFSFI